MLLLSSCVLFAVKSFNSHHSPAIYQGVLHRCCTQATARPDLVVVPFGPSQAWLTYRLSRVCGPAAT